MRLFETYLAGSAARTPHRLAPLLALAMLASGAAASAQNDGRLAPPVPSEAASLGAPAPAWLAYSTSAAPTPVALPEAPVPQISAVKPVNPGAPEPPVAPLRAKYIPAGWRAQPLSYHARLLVGAGDLYSFEDLGAILLSAGYEQVLNSEPNYGTDKGAFGERLGAAAIRETSQGIFTDMVFAPLLHEDSRYYQEGPSHNVVHRTLYAITRPLITRTDNGGQTVNAALLLGYAASAALTPTFYPPINRNFHDTLSTFGGSIGGAALGFAVSEFATDILSAVHLKHNR